MDLIEKAENEFSNLRKAESSAKHKFEMLKQFLVDFLSAADECKADADAEAPSGNAWRLR